MSMDNVFQIPGYKEIKDGDTTLWEKAAQQTKTGQSVTFRNTRKSPDYPATTILPHAKVKGNPVLWGSYKPCDGITNGANTSIDTGIYANDNMEILVRFKAIAGSFYIIQARQNTDTTIYGISGGQSGNTINSYGVSSSIRRTAEHIYTVKITMVKRAVTLYVKDETTGTEDTKTGTAAPSTYPFPSATTIKLFGDASKLAPGATVYRAYIKVNSQMVWNMYPCVDVDDGNKAVAYDSVTRKASVKLSGSFTGGSIIQPVEYLDSDGQFINTHIPGDTATSYNGYKLESTLQALNVTDTCYIEGKDNRDGTYSLFYGALGFQVVYGCTSNDTTKIPDTDKHTFVYTHLNGTTTVLCDETEVLTKNNEKAGGAMILCGTVHTYRSSSRHWEKKIWKDDELILDLIPIRLGTEYCMFDLVNFTVYHNVGPGAFSGGPDVTIEVKGEGVGDKTANLFDKMAVTTGEYLNGTGASVTNPNWNVSDYMPVESEQTYYQTINVPGTAPKTCWYTADKTFISASAQVAGGTQTAPSNAAYCRMSIWWDELDTVMFTKGSSAPTKYIPYGYKISVTLDSQTYDAYLDDMLYDGDEYDFQTAATPILLTTKATHIFENTNTIKGDVSVTYLGKE